MHTRGMLWVGPLKQLHKSQAMILCIAHRSSFRQYRSRARALLLNGMECLVTLKQIPYILGHACSTKWGPACLL